MGAGGLPLTASQAQHLQLARLLLLDPALAILDEATAEAGSERCAFRNSVGAPSQAATNRRSSYKEKLTDFERYSLTNSAQVPVLCAGVFLDPVVPGRARLVLEDMPGEQ